ncbi:hypothetical protein FRY77_36445 [Halomonas sp. MG34]|nr:hypothetical protein [Halomonas sp. MG34]
MLNFVKYDLIMPTWGTLLTVLLTIPLFYVVMLPSIFVFNVYVMTILIGLFFTDQRSKSRLYMSSLPVKRASIVKGRYVSILMVSIFFIFYQGLWGRVLSLLFENNYYIYSWKDMLVLLCMAALIEAVAIPIYYGLTSFLMATGGLAFLYFFSIIFSLPPLTNVLGMEREIIFNDLDPGFVLLVEKYIPFQPYITLSLVTAILFYLSLKLSELLFVKKAKVS